MSKCNSEHSIVIDAQKTHKEYLMALLSYRELFYFFAWRDILVRYKQAVFGVAWAIVRPLLTMAVFTFLFGRVANLPSGNVNYALFVLAAMLPWQLFSIAAIDTCNCLVIQAPLVSKTYFPRIIIPLAQVVVHLLDFSIAVMMLLALMLAMGALTPWTFLFLPLSTLLIILLCAGSGLWLSALTVKYRDFRIIAPFFVQFGMFLSPIGYGTFIISDNWMWLYCLNPMVGIVDAFRWTFFGITHPHLNMSLSFSVAITGALLISGYCYFRKMESSFADMI